MVVRLIDADKLEREIMLLPDEDLCEDCCYTFVNAINDAPTVEPVGKFDWISVKDALPTEIGLYCWVCGTGWEEPDLDWWEGSGGFYRNSIAEVTHWIPCPMPEPPKEVSGDA